MSIPKRIEIPQFPGGKRIAVTTSFDDGVIEDRRVVEAFNNWGLKGTFNLNSALMPRTGSPAPEGSHYLDTSEVAALYQGHEVAMHMATHPWPSRLDPNQIALEVLEDRKALEDLVGYPVRGLAYPFGDTNARVIEVLRALGVVYARTTQTSANCFPPAEPLAWATTAHQYDSNPDTVPERFARLYDNPRYGGVFFVWGHTYEFDRRDDWASLERIYRPLAGKSDVWYCTNIELFDYEAARQRLVLAANRRSAYNPSGIAVTLRVDGNLVEVPAGQTVTLG